MPESDPDPEPESVEPPLADAPPESAELPESLSSLANGLFSHAVAMFIVMRLALDSPFIKPPASLYFMRISNDSVFEPPHPVIVSISIK